ncbi:MAG TPA: PPK2 family polyphosphate kinase [Thermoanaerobaculia bacterium]|jgi:PPK2 family polyphosphate:nucleotide phosphotransferase|nr:PPK2 family polyphosphate kinase [Thermoanaerobaculia bacterium]
MKLSQIDTNAPGDKVKTQEATAKLVDRIGELQELLYAGHQHKVLIILQGMDTSGKDGAIRKVLRETSPQGIHVVSFKKPTETELDHDYLWRVHWQVPGRGELVVFNRSHYEDVLVVRVHSLVPKAVWKKRYEQINNFERMLADEGTTILKFFLHISREEQRERLQARLDDPTKRWKFQHGDLAERKLWSAYMRAYEEVLEKTSTQWASWHIVPADRKVMRDFIVASEVVKALEKLKMKYPDPPDVAGVTIK